jgi:hypothetical protein
MKMIVGLALCLMVLAMPGGIAYSQGHWDEYSLAGFGSGASLAARGDGCLGYTKSNAQILLVYDIGVGDWLAIDLRSIQLFQNVSTEGNVVFAYSDNLLVGYSATTQSWDSITYSGGALTGGYHYGCGDNLAYFLTQSYLFVFDADVGTWS